MKHIWSLLCQRSSIDVDNNQLSIFNCLEEISLSLDNSEALKRNLVIPIEFQLVSYWSREIADVEFDLLTFGELVDASGKLINTFTNSFPIKQGVLRFRNRTNIQGLKITGPGRYYLRLYRQSGQDNAGDFTKDLVTELPIDIKISYKIMDLPKKMPRQR